MKAISLWQPWATAIARGSKRMETRSWPTFHRGPIAIHAAKRRIKSEMDAILFESYWRGALGVPKIIECRVRVLESFN